MTDTAPTRLDAQALVDLPRRLPHWRLEPAGGGRLCRRFEFADFAQAFAFMTAVAAEAERRNHHPEWSNVYHRVDIAWTTHDLGGVSTLDLELAAAVDALHARMLHP